MVHSVTSISLDYSRDDAKTLVKAAFERTRGIETYFDDSHRIIGKTGSSFTSYGEKIIVDIPEKQPSDTETIITVWAEREIEMNMTASPEKYKSRFLTEFERYRGHSVKNVLESFDNNHRSKEVSNPNDQASGHDTLKVVLTVTAIFMIFFMFMPLFLIP